MGRSLPELFSLSLYHFWQPYNFPTILFLCIPMVIAAWKTRDLRVSLFVHMLLNLVGASVSLVAIVRMQ